MVDKKYQSKIHKQSVNNLHDLFEDISLKHDVSTNEISITKDNFAFYICKKKYCGLSGRDEYKLLEIIEL